jgi:hypothetical protein
MTAPVLTQAEALGLAAAYIEGVADRDAARLAATFHEAAHIIGQDEGKLSIVPRDRWIAFVCAEERAGWGARDYQVVTFHIDGSVATAVVETVYGRFAYRDTLVMLATPEGPRIVGKTYHQMAPAA